MPRFLLLLWLSGIAFPVHGQQLRNPVPPSYNTDMQRLLVISTANFIYGICQGQMDRDSSIVFSASMFGLSRLLAYNEDFSSGKDYPGQQLIDSGRISTAEQRLANLQGDARLQLLAELGIYYLHKPGTEKKDIDNATIFIEQLYQAANTKWLPYSLWLLGQLYNERNEGVKSRQYLEQATAIYRKAGNVRMLAISLLYQAGALPPGLPERETYLREALNICKKAKFLLLQYRVMIVLLLDHTHTHPELVLNELQEALALEKKIGFLHHQYVYSVLSYWYSMQGNLLQAKLNAEDAITCMEITKDTALSTTYCRRMSEANLNLNNLPVAIYWNTRALSVPKTRETQVLWFKSILDKMRLLNTQHLYEQSLELAKDINRRYPPTNTFDKMHLTYNMGYCYDALHQDEQALDYYLQFLDMAKHFPPQFAYAEILVAYNQVSNFYFRKGNYATSREYAMKILEGPIGQGTVPTRAAAYHLLFRLDSVAGRYASAIQHYQKFHRFADSTYSISQRKKMDELTVQYETRKKDQDIRILTKDSQLQKEKLARSSMMGNATLAGVAVLLIIVGLLYNQYRAKQKVNRETQARNATLQQLVEEKEWLLREVHHRVKNNLQTIVSLLESQSANLQDEALLAIQESQNRIHAMSLIHQKLYHNENISSVNMGAYLPELVQYLCDSYDVRSKIQVTVKVQEAELDVSQAIPLGLIVNEAVTNAIKYAFPQSRSNNNIVISFSGENGSHAKLCISDNGTGIAPGILNSKIQGLGLKLIRGLAKDIDATLDIHSTNGTSITIAFQVSAPLRSVTELPATNLINATV